MFLQVLEPFCPLPEQEIWEPEELGVSQPTGSTTVFITSENELNISPPPYDSSSTATQTHQSRTASITETEAVLVPPTVVTHSSFPDAESVPPPAPLSDCASTSLPYSVSVPSLSNIPSSPHTEAPPAENYLYISSQAKSELSIYHSCVDIIDIPCSEVLSE